MKPFYQTPTIKLYHGDCHEIQINETPAAIITDPPYEIDIARGDKGCLESPYLKSKNLLDLTKGFDIPNTLTQWAAILNQKGTIWLFCSNNQIGEIMQTAQSLGYKPTLTVWHKYNSIPFCNNTFRQDAEFMICCRSKGAGLNGTLTQKSKIKRHPIVKTEYKHPTIKPLPIVEDMVLMSTKENDLVFDPFAGSGTTAIACKKHNRRFIGCEINETYCQIFAERISE